MRTLCLLLALGATHAWAATTGSSAQLPATHWAVHAVSRLHDAGLVAHHLPAQSAVPLEYIRSALETAVERARGQLPERVALAEGYLARFEEEFSRTPLLTELVRLEGAAFSGGGRGISSRSRPAPAGRTGIEEARAAVPMAAPLSAVSPTLGASLYGVITPYIGIMLSPELDDSALALPSWEAVAAWKGVAFSVGRTRAGYGLEGERSFVLSGSQVLPRVELQTTEPFALPGFLRHIGWISLNSFLARLSDSRHLGQPYLWGASIRAQPHARLTLSLQRAVMLGGDGVSEPYTARKFLKMVFATKNQRENNVMSLSGRWRLPTEGSLPLTAYAEWGADDLGAQFKAPGILFGLRTPAIPSRPELSLGAEFAFLGAVCCRTFQWYSHHIYQGGWISDETPLGHPLGGDGREYRVYGSLTLLDARLRLEADMFLRQRFQVNLYSPYREGNSLGMSSTLGWRISRRAELGLRASHEAGRSWRLGQLEGRATLYF